MTQIIGGILIIAYLAIAGSWLWGYLRESQNG